MALLHYKPVFGTISANWIKGFSRGKTLQATLPAG